MKNTDLLVYFGMIFLLFFFCYDLIFAFVVILAKNSWAMFTQGHSDNKQ